MKKKLLIIGIASLFAIIISCGNWWEIRQTIKYIPNQSLNHIVWFILTLITGIAFWPSWKKTKFDEEDDGTYTLIFLGGILALAILALFYAVMGFIFEKDILEDWISTQYPIGIVGTIILALGFIIATAFDRKVYNGIMVSAFMGMLVTFGRFMLEGIMTGKWLLFGINIMILGIGLIIGIWYIYTHSTTFKKITANIASTRPEHISKGRAKDKKRKKKKSQKRPW